MGRGFFSGVIWGLAVSVLGAAVLSLVAPPSPKPAVVAAVPGPASQPSGSARGSGVGQARTDADLAEAAPAVPDTADAAPDTLASLADGDTRAGALPEVGGVAGALDAPDAESADTGVTVSTDRPVAAAAPRSAPAVPQGEGELSISTVPAQPTVPDLTGGRSGFAAPQTGDAGTDRDAVIAALPDEPDEPVLSPRPGSGPTGAGGAAATAPSADDLTENQPTPGPVPEIVPLAAGQEPPIDRFAAAWTPSEDKPRLSIVLIDGPGALGADALENFPYPITIALDPSDPGAPERMVRHRAAGFEVAALMNLPATATADETEAALALALAALPETVAIIEGTGSGIQGDSTVADQVTAVAKMTGRGLITQGRGLNTVQKEAARDGVPSGVVFRDFDGAGQSPTVMRRFLDQAAFRAGQDGAVIMLGRVRPDTISALLLWGLQETAGQVALAPVSAALSVLPD